MCSPSQLTPHHQAVFSAGPRPQWSLTENLRRQTGQVNTRKDKKGHVTSRRTPADGGVDPEELPGLSKGKEQQSLQVQRLHQQPGEVGQNTPVEEHHGGFAPRLRSHRGHR